MDVKNAFLNGDLLEKVYMTPPRVPHKLGEVCKLHKALYGLKQAILAWFEKFSTVILRYGFHASDFDPALFIHSTSTGSVFLLLYVDGMILTGDDCVRISDLKVQLQREFEMKDLGAFRYFLGIEVDSFAKGYLLSQSKYVTCIIE